MGRPARYPIHPWWSDRRVVYGLAGPDGVIRYVGGTRNLSGRAIDHSSKARRGCRGGLYEWMRSVGASQVAVVVIDLRGSLEVEADEIRRRALAGDQLFNHTHNPLVDHLWRVRREGLANRARRFARWRSE